MYKLYPPFAEVSERSRLCLRVLQLRETFTDTPKEPTDEEVKIAEKITLLNLDTAWSLGFWRPSKTIAGVRSGPSSQILTLMITRDFRVRS